MSQVETPVLPQGRSVTNPGKTAKAKVGLDGREEKGAAFRMLLQDVNGKPAQNGLAKVEKESDGAKPASSEEGGPAEPVHASIALQTPILPIDGAASSDAATRLLGDLQLSGRDPPEPRGEPTIRRATMAALGTALTDARQATRTDGARPGSLAPAGERGVTMPDDPGDIPPGDVPGPTALSRLSELVAEKAPDQRSTEAAPSRPLSITVTRQETYLPPVMRISPFQQVVEPLLQAVSDLVSGGAATVPELGADRPAEISRPTKVLHIELRPVELGTITVKLRLSQGGMEIRLETSRVETAQMLANDKDALREVVRASGFSADAVSIEAVHIETMAPDRPAANSGEGSAEARSAPRDGQGRGFDQSRQGENRQDPRQHAWSADAAASKDDSHDPHDTGRLRRDPLRYI